MYLTVLEKSLSGRFFDILLFTSYGLFDKCIYMIWSNLTLKVPVGNVEAFRY